MSDRQRPDQVGATARAAVTAVGDEQPSLGSESLRRLGDAAGISVWTWHLGTDEVFHLSGGRAASTISQGTPLATVLGRVHPGDRGRVRRTLLRAARAGASGNIRFRHSTNKRVRHYIGTFFPLPGQAGAIEVIVQDVTRAVLQDQRLRESEDHYRHAVDLHPEITWLAESDGSIIEAGPRWFELTGLTLEETLGTGWSQALHPDDLGGSIERWQASLETGSPLDMEYRVRLKGGTYRWMRARAAARRDATGRIIRWYGTLEDVHERRLAISALKASDEFARSLLESSVSAIEGLDLEGHVIFMNGPGLRALEIDDFEAIRGTRFEAFWPEPARPALLYAIDRGLHGETTRQMLYGPTAKGKPRWWDFTLSPVYAEGKIARLLASLRDITERRQAEQQLEYMARHDTLTGLANRLEFQHQLETALEQRTRGGALAVLSLDLDDFKVVNDTLGHPAGDELLRQVSARLRGVAGHSTVARLGGDEFALIRAVATAEEAADTARRLLAALNRPFRIDGETVRIGASIGIAMAPTDAEDAERLFQNADIALYRVKHEKGRGFRFFEREMDEALRVRRELKRELSQALGRGELSVHYQPQFAIGINKLVGFEALLRWTHPTYGRVPPDQFIPLAEESGAIEEIGAFVLHEACATAAQWSDAISIAVNLSAAQLRRGGLQRTITEALRTTGLDPHRLELEITESVLMDESSDGLAILDQLHAEGIRVALDDFGTGYSSLSYLRRFPFDKIKIDRSFVLDLPGSRDSAAIVRAIIGLGRSLRTRITAEGVETWEQLMMLHAEGCDEAQGYLFSPAMPASDATALAATRSPSFDTRNRPRKLA